MSKKDGSRRDSHIAERGNGEGVKAGAATARQHRGIDEPVRDQGVYRALCRTGHDLGQGRKGRDGNGDVDAWFGGQGLEENGGAERVPHGADLAGDFPAGFQHLRDPIEHGGEVAGLVMAVGAGESPAFAMGAGIVDNAAVAARHKTLGET